MLALMVMAACATSPGCAVIDSGTNAARETARMFRPRPFDESAEETVSDDTESDPWGFVGKEGRADQEAEVDPDPWFRRHLMSDRARQIEANLGIE